MNEKPPYHPNDFEDDVKLTDPERLDELAFITIDKERLKSLLLAGWTASTKVDAKGNVDELKVFHPSGELIYFENLKVLSAIDKKDFEGNKGV